MSQVLNAVTPADTVEAQRRLVFGCLMQYSAESIPLRERALEAAVLASMVGSSAGNPFRNGDVQRNFRAGSIDLRQEVVRATLNNLIEKGLVSQVEVRKKPAYFLTDLGEQRTREGSCEAKTLLAPVLDEVLTHADGSMDRTLASAVLEDFVCTSFARFGASIAGFVTGRSPHFANSLELAITFDEIAAKHFVPSELRASLKTRCMDVFKARSQASQRLVFHLTQGYCFAQLLGIDRTDFNPITEQAFRDAVFYLDTNVIFTGLLSGDRGNAFAEVLGIAKRIGVQLRVTRATIDEARHTAADKLDSLAKIADTVPLEVGELSADEFVVRFYELRRRKPGLQPSEFLAEFDQIADVVRDRWQIEIEEITTESFLTDSETLELAERLQAATIASRGYKKGQRVLDHDLTLLELVRRTRASIPKTWFLTRDRSLLNTTAEQLRFNAGDDRPLCFSILGFLQSISPFVRSADEENIVASFFGGLLSEQVFVSEKLFDARELALISEMHSDVMSMPPDQVVVAVDYVKNHILKGEAYRAEKVPLVALELRKFLTANSEEKQRALEEIAAQTRDRFEATKREMMRERALREEYEVRLQRAEDELEQSRSDIETQKIENENIKQVSLAHDARFRSFLRTGVFVLAGFAIRQFGPLAVNWITARESWPWLQRGRLELIVGLIWTGFLVFPLFWLIPREKIKGDARTALIVALIISWFCVNGLQSSKVVADLSAVATLGLYFVLFLRTKD